MNLFQLIIMYILIGGSIVYCITCLFALSGHMRPLRTDKMNRYPQVSIIIAARNEENTIGPLLDDLIKQDYPGELLAILIVDDHSRDNTREIIRSRLEKHLGLHLLEMDVSERGKKAALQKGILAASHPVILNTDGEIGAAIVEYEAKRIRRVQAEESGIRA